MKFHHSVALTALVGGVVLSVLLYLTVLVRPKTKAPVEEVLLCDYAHRGLHDGQIPENSLAAFARACEAGVGIELDVRLSRDGVVMVFHDETLLRMTGEEGKLSGLDRARLQTLTLGESEETIPTLEEVLRLVDGRVPLLVELKGKSPNAALCKAVGELLETYEGPYCLESFNPLLLRGMRKRLPKAPCGLLYTNICRDKKRYSPAHLAIASMSLNFLARPQFIACNQADRDSLPVRIAADLYGVPRFLWTVDTEEALRKAHERGENAIFEHLPPTAIDETSTKKP